MTVSRTFAIAAFAALALNSAPALSETPAAGTPKAETTAAETETPKAETTAAETPKAETTAAETPKAETTAAETPKAEVETPNAETPKAEAPKTETPTADAAGSQTGLVARAMMTSSVVDREPVDEVGSLMNDSETVYFFTELKDMQGQSVTHRWTFNGQVVGEVPFEVGGPRWRVWSTKSLEPSWLGTWTVSVVDSQGDVLKTKTFDYTKHAPPAPSTTTAPAAPAPAAPAIPMN